MHTCSFMDQSSVSSTYTAGFTSFCNSWKSNQCSSSLQAPVHIDIQSSKKKLIVFNKRNYRQSKYIDKQELLGLIIPPISHWIKELILRWRLVFEKLIQTPSFSIVLPPQSVLDRLFLKICNPPNCSELWMGWRRDIQRILF